MKISSLLSTSLLDYLDGSEDATSTDFSTSILPEGTYTKLAAAKYLKDNDKDHDGVLEADEVTISDAAYAKLDANSDGKVTQGELANALKGDDNAIFQYYSAGGAQSSTDIASELLSSSNVGGLASNGYVALGAKRFLAKMDADGDSLLTSNESGLSASAFSDIDTNDDGKLSLVEIKTALAKKNALITQYYKGGGTASLVNLTAGLLKTI